MNGIDLHTWFAPRLHKTTANIVTGAPTFDSTDVSYDAQLCFDSLDLFNPPKTILAGNQSHVIAYDVWDLPEGVWVFSLAPTNKFPGDVSFVYDGMVFEYRLPEDGQDSVNAWLGLAERQKRCNDFDGAFDWIDRAIAINPHSVPAWWTKASYHFSNGDSLLCFQAYDSAFKFLDQELDPLLPDTTNSVEPVERLYMRALRPTMETDRYGAERYGFWHK
ncbi:MAG: hypothetical protein H6506_02260 [Calditrichaeota bacterium]|nr:hypothetical protein [Calditrichota bacterium]MCB9391457.1 hypothetical protein [Calditrichota bacterium]